MCVTVPNSREEYSNLTRLAGVSSYSSGARLEQDEWEYAAEIKVIRAASEARAEILSPPNVSGAKPKYLEYWWSWPGSNRRPHRCERCALPAELQPHMSGSEKILSFAAALFPRLCCNDVGGRP